MQLVLDTRGLSVKKRNGCFYICSQTENRLISPLKLSSIAVTQPCTFSSEALLLAIEHQIPVLFFNQAGKPKGRVWSVYFANLPAVRRQQVLFASTTQATQWIITNFQDKQNGQTQNLQYLAAMSPLDNIALTQTVEQIQSYTQNLTEFSHLPLEQCAAQLMGIEGNIARMYWQCLGTNLPPEYRFSARTRQPAQDLFNAALNYLYGMLYNVVEGAVISAGLDPYLGFLHTDEYGRSAFSYDFIEPYRFFIDRLLMEQCFSFSLQEHFFEHPEGNDSGVKLTKDGRHYLISLFNNHIHAPVVLHGKQTSIKKYIYAQAGRFALFLLNQQVPK